jgi:hypothetical protein
MSKNTQSAVVTQQISISMDGTWAGSGVVRNGIIEDCGAQFCRDSDESEAVYELIESAIANGKTSLKTVIDGDAKQITWEIS